MKISISMKPELVDTLTAMAHGQHRSRSNMIECIVLEYLDRKNDPLPKLAPQPQYPAPTQQPGTPQYVVTCVTEGQSGT